MNIRVYRIAYGGVCEIWVESDGRAITRILAATADGTLLGRDLSDLPAPRYVETKQIAGPEADALANYAC